MKWAVTSFLLVAFNAIAAFAFKNPLKDPNGADPHMTYWQGNYYLVTTTWTDVEMTWASSLSGLRTAKPKVIYSTTAADHGFNVWAPELQYLDGRWNIIYTAGTKGGFDNQRLHVLIGGASPQDDFTYKVLRHSTGNYVVYSSWAGAKGDEQSLFIAKLKNAYTVESSSVLISAPTLDWERQGTNVNEGPAALYRNGRTWLTFSASGCASGKYALGLLELTGADPLKASSWVKKSTPVFQTYGSVWAPGHNGFFTSPDGKDIWIVYHATSTNSGLCDGSRTTRAQIVNWNSDGTPNFGTPIPLTVGIAEPK